MNKKIIVWVLVGVLLIAGLVFPRGNSVVQQIVGAMPGPEISSPFLSVNGVEQWYYSSGFNNASTTVCSFKTPAATTTVQFASVNITTATSTALVWNIAQAAVMDATTTAIASPFSTAADAKGTILATTTNAGVNIIGPSQYVNVKFGAATGITATTNSAKGNCKLILIKN